MQGEATQGQPNLRPEALPPPPSGPGQQQQADSKWKVPIHPQREREREIVIVSGCVCVCVCAVPFGVCVQVKEKLEGMGVLVHLPDDEKEQMSWQDLGGYDDVKQYFALRTHTHIHATVGCAVLCCAALCVLVGHPFARPSSAITQAD